MLDMIGLMGLFPKEYEETILNNSIGGVQNAANNFQWGIVKGMDRVDDVNFRIINSLYVGSYPKRYKEKKIPYFKFEHAFGKKDINVGFCNITVYKNLSKYIGIKKEIDKWAKVGIHSNKVVIAYAMTSPFVEILKYIKKTYPDILCILVVPDLPEYMNVASESKYLYRKLKKIQVNHFKRNLKKIDGYVLLTDAMKEWFDEEINYVVVEGIASRIIEETNNTYSSNNKKSILYAGMIEEKYGVLDLVKSFMKIENDEWELNLYGVGQSLEKIKEISKIDNRVNIHGIVQNSLVREEQKKADILINPRNDNHEFTKYSFPSKIIEYMSSGTPMIGYKLSGMPDEYRKYFYEIPQTDNGIYETLIEVMSKTDDQRKKMGMEALEFIKNKKNSKIQCEKILELVYSLKNSSK